MRCESQSARRLTAADTPYDYSRAGILPFSQEDFMNKPTKLALAISFALSVSAFGTAWAEDAPTGAELDSEALQMNAVSLNHGEANVTQKIASDFTDFAGDENVGETNAESLVTGLRSGSEITLEGSRQKLDGDGNPELDAAGNPVLESYTHSFTPATGHLGYGNVFISLALAQELLKQEGITDPTPEQIEAALNGGTITVERVNEDGSVSFEDVELQGIAQLRSEGMGWGNIAKTLEIKKLGPVISSIKSGKERMMESDNAAGGIDTSVAAVDKHGYTDKGSKPDHAAKHGGRPDDAGRPDKVEKVERVERPDKPEKVARPDRPERPEKAMKPEKPDRPGKG
jgi:hypothetical protein